MVIFIPYYRQHGQFIHSRARPSAPSNGLNTNNTTTTTVQSSACKLVSNILCRFTFSLFLFIIALFIIQLPVYSANEKEGSNIVAIILLTVAVVSFLRTCQALRRYYVILHTRRRIIQRLREQQQVYDLALLANNGENPGMTTNGITDLPSYKELFPSHLDISYNGNNPSSTLLPPSYDDFVKTLFIRHPATTLPLSSSRPHALSLPNTSLSTSSPSQINSARCLWITDRTQRPVCIRGGNVTYV